MDWLVHKHHEAELKKLRRVSYHYNNSFTFPSTHKISSHSFNSSKININIKPNIFFQKVPSPSPVSIRNKWFINLSSLPIPTNVQCLLQLGDNFSLPETNKKKWQLNSLKILSLTLNYRLLHKHTWEINLSLSWMVWHVLPLSSMIVLRPNPEGFYKF